MATHLHGFGTIARYIGMYDRGTVEGYATRRFDPLPLRLRGRAVRVLDERLDLWKRRNDARKRKRRDPTIPYVEGLREVARVVGISVETAKRLAKRKRDPLPVEKPQARRRWAYVSALQEWIDRADVPYAAVRRGPSSRRKRWTDYTHELRSTGNGTRSSTRSKGQRSSVMS